MLGSVENLRTLRQTALPGSIRVALHNACRAQHPVGLEYTILGLTCRFTMLG
jgi:hypothetical protein